MIDARAKILLVLCVSVLAVVLERTLSLGALAAASALAAVLARRSWADLARISALILALAWATALSQGLFYADHPRTALVRFGPVVLWREGLMWGGAQALRWIAIGAAGLAFGGSTPPDQTLVALSRLGVPAPLALLVATALRAVGDLAGVWSDVRAARAARGRPIWARDPIAWIRLEVELLVPVVGRAARRARMLARTLEARGYVPGAARAAAPAPRARLDLAVAAIACALTLAATGARVAHALYVAEILYIPELRPLYAWVRAWL